MCLKNSYHHKLIITPHFIGKSVHNMHTMEKASKNFSTYKDTTYIPWSLRAKMHGRSVASGQFFIKLQGHSQCTNIQPLLTFGGDHSIRKKSIFVCAPPLLRTLIYIQLLPYVPIEMAVYSSCVSVEGSRNVWQSKIITSLQTHTNMSLKHGSKFEILSSIGKIKQQW